MHSPCRRICPAITQRPLHCTGPGPSAPAPQAARLVQQGQRPPKTPCLACAPQEAWPRRPARRLAAASQVRGRPPRCLAAPPGAQQVPHTIVTRDFASSRAAVTAGQPAAAAACRRSRRLPALRPSCRHRVPQVQGPAHPEEPAGGAVHCGQGGSQVDRRGARNWPGCATGLVTAAARRAGTVPPAVLAQHRWPRSAPGLAESLAVRQAHRWLPQATGRRSLPRSWHHWERSLELPPPPLHQPAACLCLLTRCQAPAT